jgi:CBS domain-containing protein
MKVKDVMTTDITTVSPRASFPRLWEIIFKKGIHAIPICEKDKLSGIVSEEDLLAKLYPSYEDYITDFTNARKFEDMENKLGKLKHLTAGDIMNKKIYLTYPERPIMRALSKMILRRIRQLPVIEKESGNKLVGLISKGDIFDALFNKHLRK